ncbi:MAG: CRISPR-associated endonuclease Cas1 [Candidatus Thorarchaeota archaeon]|nr:CRISPR-associated endonuclease Cas1 [Candidatus Thorarchaeota archaeon]
MHTVILEEFGTFLGKKRDRLVVKKDGKTLAEFPVSQVERVIVSSAGASLSSAALYLAVENRVPVSFTYSDGTPFGFLTPTEGHGTVLTRRAQYLEAGTEKALHLAKGFVTGKLLNQQALLSQWARSRTRTDAESSDKLFELADRVKVAQTELGGIEGPIDVRTRDSIMNIEGRAASAYWEGVAAIVPDEFDFSNRNTRSAKDPFNMMLNYGYGILYSEVWSAVNAGGLDPFAGFLHVDRPGRPSLVLDLIEEFRQQAVDRVIVRLTTKQVIRAAETAESGELSKQTRQVLATEVVGRLSEQVQVRDSKIELKNAIVRQAWAVAKFLRGESSRYEPFSLRW